MPHDRPGTLEFLNGMFCSYRISTDKRVARSLCHSRATCFLYFLQDCSDTNYLLDLSLTMFSTKQQVIHCRWSTWTSFSDFSRDGAIAANFWAKLVTYPLFDRLTFVNGLKYGNSDFKNIQWQYFSYILCNVDEDRSSHPKYYEGNNCTVLNETAKWHIPPNISVSTGPIFTNLSA